MQKSPIVIKIGTYFKTEFKTEETSATVVAQPVLLALLGGSKRTATSLTSAWATQCVSKEKKNRGLPYLY